MQILACLGAPSARRRSLEHGGKPHLADSHGALFRQLWVWWGRRRQAEGQTLTVLTMVYSGQAIFYVSRERRRLWRSRPGPLLFVGSFIETTLFSALAGFGFLMAPLPPIVLVCVFAGAMVLALVLDTVKVALFRRLPIV